MAKRSKAYNAAAVAKIEVRSNLYTPAEAVQPGQVHLRSPRLDATVDVVSPPAR